MNPSNPYSQKGLISVIIPTYNSIQWVGRAIQSVQNQTYKTIEIIVVDDGSTDGTYDYVKKFYPDITVYKKSNGGIASARNCGVNSANGEFIAFLDSDDIMDPSKLEVQLGVLRDIPDWGLCGTDAWFFLADEEVVTTPSKPLKNNLKISLIDHITLLKGNELITSSVLTKREILFKAGCFDENLHRAEDYDLWLRISEYWQVVLVKEKLLWYQITPGSLSENRIAERLDVLKVLNKWKQTYPKIVLPVLRKHSLSLTRKLLRVGRRNEAEKVFWGPYSNKKNNWVTKLEFSILTNLCKIHTLFFSSNRKK
jgi:glycosyltransferase involved in cell wall biosynthesis